MTTSISEKHWRTNPENWARFPTFNPLKWYGSVVKILVPGYFEACIFEHAVKWTRRLHEQPRMAMEEADRDFELRSVRRFWKTIPYHLKEDSKIQALSKEIIAAKLGIEVNVMETHEGFFEFARDNYLERYLMHHGHRLVIDNATIFIKQENEMRPWGEVRPTIRPIKREQPSWPWHYGESGVQNDDFYAAGPARPYMHSNPSKWGNQDILVICVCCDAENGFAKGTGDHTYFRICTADGDIYSTGLYRPGKREVLDSFNDPFRIKPGYIQQPDVTDYWDNTNPRSETVNYNNIHQLSIKIPEGKLPEILSMLNKDREMNMEVFHILNQNCTIWALKYAKQAGFECNSSTLALQILLSTRIGRMVVPLFIQKTIRHLAKPLPRVLKQLFLYPLIVALNLKILCLGGRKIDPAVIKRFEQIKDSQRCFQTISNEEICMLEKQVQPYLKHWWDIFRPSKNYMTHPYHLVHVEFKRIKEWRAAKIKELEAEKRALADQFEGTELENKLTKIQKKIEFEIPYFLPPLSKVKTL